MKTQEFSPITVNMDIKGGNAGILDNYGKPVVQLRQVVKTTTEYEAREGNSRAGSIAGISAKVGGATYENTSTRTTLFAIEKGVTAEQVVEALKALPAARLYQVLSLSPVTTSGQDYQISKGTLDKDTLAMNQAVQDDKGNYVVDNGGLIYRACFFVPEPREDEDERDMSAPYTPAALAHLLAPAIPMAATPAQEAAIDQEVAETAAIN